MNNNIFLSRGWHDVEGHFESRRSWRWTKGTSFIKIPSDLDKIIIHADRANIVQEIELSGAVDDKLDFVKLTQFNFSVGDPINIEVPVKGYSMIRMKTNTFIPKKITIGNEDTRSLGIMVFGLTTVRGGVSESLKISNIPNLIDDDSYSKDELLYINVEKYFSRKDLQLKQNINNIDNVTVVLTCHSDSTTGDRLSFGKRSYESILTSGIKNVVIVISGNDISYRSWAQSLSNRHKVVTVVDPNKNNNDCWIEGLKLVDTYWSIILHDDDVMLPSIQEAVSYLNEQCLFGMWQGSVVNHHTQNVELEKTVDFRSKSGIYNVSMLKHLVIQNKSAISPIHGVFPTKAYIHALTDWEVLHGKNEFFKPFANKPQFVVGNDYYIWCHFLNFDGLKFLYYNEKCTKCISHDGSSTQIDLRKSEPSFYKIYDNLKTLHIKNNIKVGCLLYVNDLNDGVKQSLKNLSEYKMSKFNIPFVLYSDNHHPSINHVKINKIEKMEGGYYTTKDKYAFWSFVESIKIAKEYKWDYFFIYEWDCRVGRDYWFDLIWEEHLAWPHKPIITGTPAVRYPKLNIGNFCRVLESYAYHYSKECHVSMNVDLATPISLYTNGALTFYDTEELCEYYTPELTTVIQDKSNHVDEVGPWDFGLGIRIFKKLKEDSFKRVGWLPSVYSGCGDYCYNQRQRDLMLESNLKAVIHQYKYL